MSAARSWRVDLARLGKAATLGISREFMVLSLGAALLLLCCAIPVLLRNEDPDAAAVGITASYFFGSAMTESLLVVGLRAVRGGLVSLGSLFSILISPLRWLRSVVIVAIVVVTATVGFALLVLPGLYLLARFGFAPLAAAEENRGPLDALSRSWDLSRGEVGPLMLVVGVSLLLMWGALASIPFLLVPVVMVLVVSWGGAFDVLRERRAGRV